MLLIAGSEKDINLQRLANAASSRRYLYKCIFYDAASPPIDWDMDANILRVQNEVIPHKNTALFLRPCSGKDATQDFIDNATIWYETLYGWALYNKVAIVNHRRVADESKIRNLQWAKEAGFHIPSTRILNDFKTLENPDDWIVKPVTHGAHTLTVADFIEKQKFQPKHYSWPWFVQEKLTYPEIRLFQVGKWFFAFRVVTDHLDNRTDLYSDLTEIPPPKELTTPMKRLTKRLGLDYAAADLKTCPKTGRMVFLEINSLPMFTAYDNAAKGRLSDAVFLLLKRKARMPLIFK
jgi:hypothetical protein